MGQVDIQINGDGSIRVKQHEAGTVRIWVDAAPAPVTVTTLREFTVGEDGKIIPLTSAPSP